MELIVEGRNLEINQRLQRHVARKLGQIGRHLPAATAAIAEITAETTRSCQERFRAQISLTVKGAIIRTEGRGASAIAAVNAAAARLDHSAARFKAHAYRSQRARQYLSLGEQQAADRFESDRELARRMAPEPESVPESVPKSVEDAALAALPE